MMSAVDYLLDRSSAALLVFTAAAALSHVVRLSPGKRIAIGLLAIAAVVLIPISTRSAFDWIVSAIERPAAPGLLLLALFASSAVTGQRFDAGSEFRFGTAMLVLIGVLIYPGAVGFLNYDPYALGYSGYVLPLGLILLLGYAVFRRYFYIAAALNIAILTFLLNAGRSLNLWDYVIDPLAWLLAIGAWVSIAITALIRKTRRTNSVVT